MRYLLLFLFCIATPLAIAQENEEAKPVDAMVYQVRSVLVLFDDGHYLIHSFPDELEVYSINTVTLQADESILINYAYDYSGSYRYLLLNPYTGVTEAVPLACGRVPFASLENARWMFLEENRQIYLCSTATDERHLLPADINWMPFENYHAPFYLSPNGDWLMLFATVENEIYNDFTLYSYEIATRQLRYLGYIEYEIPSMFPPQLDNWVSNHLGAVNYSVDGEWSSNPFYIFDASQENSLELAVRGWVYDFYDNPSRYEYLETSEFVMFQTGSEVTSMFCNLMIYDELGLRNFDLGYACGSYGDDYECSVLEAVEGGYIYLRFDSPESSTSTITFLDYITGEKRDILTAEIEAISAVIEDTVYYFADDSGQIDYPIGRGCPATSFRGEQTSQFTQETVNWR